MIDRENGNIVVSGTIRIQPDDTIESILAWQLGEERTENNMGNGWYWLTCRNVCVEDTFFIISFAFFNNALKKVHIVVSQKKFDLDAGWDTWSKENEMKALNYMKGWLKKEIGSGSSFTWGTAGAVFDERGGSSFIFIEYT